MKFYKLGNSIFFEFWWLLFENLFTTLFLDYGWALCTKFNIHILCFISPLAKHASLELWSGISVLPMREHGSVVKLLKLKSTLEGDKLPIMIKLNSCLIQTQFLLANSSITWFAHQLPHLNGMESKTQIKSAAITTILLLGFIYCWNR